MASNKSQEKLSSKESEYWSGAASQCGQIFFGIAAVTLFAGKFDQNQIFVIILALVSSIIFWILGWRLKK